ncbi:hypothetical protein B0H17DRAFT_1152550 [Mycena rosella]|uniref:Uncharacterized protein n=1 Tax=Mycena rosella TaxID=1033263 RepID=A0AAD7FG84_MYCRO|nr:hypothetical protein B0H17DRAFT_1152550 [Mycena rosella]
MAAPEVGSTFGHLIGVPKKLPYLARATNDNKFVSGGIRVAFSAELPFYHPVQFKNTRCADLSLGAIERFAHLPSNSFLAILPVEANEAESMKIYANHVEIGSRAYAMFESLMVEKELLCKAVATLNTVRRKGKADISLAELPEDDWIWDLTSEGINIGPSNISPTFRKVLFYKSYSSTRPVFSWGWLDGRLDFACQWTGIKTVNYYFRLETRHPVETCISATRSSMLELLPVSQSSIHLCCPTWTSFTRARGFCSGPGAPLPKMIYPGGMKAICFGAHRRISAEYTDFTLIPRTDRLVGEWYAPAEVHVCLFFVPTHGTAEYEKHSRTSLHLRYLAKPRWRRSLRSDRREVGVGSVRPGAGRGIGLRGTARRSKPRDDVFGCDLRQKTATIPMGECRMHCHSVNVVFDVMLRPSSWTGAQATVDNQACSLRTAAAIIVPDDDCAHSRMDVAGDVAATSAAVWDDGKMLGRVWNVLRRTSEDVSARYAIIGTTRSALPL